MSYNVTTIYFALSQRYVGTRFPGFPHFPILTHARHGKSSNPSADALLEYYKFPQIRGNKFQQKGLICDKT